MFICIMPAASEYWGRLGELFFQLIHHRVRFACVGRLDNLITGDQEHCKSNL